MSDIVKTIIKILRPPSSDEEFSSDDDSCSDNEYWN